MWLFAVNTFWIVVVLVGWGVMKDHERRVYVEHLPAPTGLNTKSLEGMDGQLAQMSTRLTSVEVTMRQILTEMQASGAAAEEVQPVRDERSTEDTVVADVLAERAAVRAVRDGLGEAAQRLSQRYEQEVSDPSRTSREQIALENAFRDIESPAITLDSIDCKTTLCRAVFTENAELDNSPDLELDLLVAISDELDRDIDVHNQNLGGHRRALYLEVR